MILMWLGSVVVTLVGFSYSQKFLAEIFAGLKQQVFPRRENESFLANFFRAIAFVILDVSPMNSRMKAVDLLSKLELDIRLSTLIMCLGVLGSWWALILGQLYMKLNGFFLLGICSFGLLSICKKDRIFLAFKFLFALGLFFLGSESMLKNSSILMTVLAQTDLNFILADGRFPVVVGLMIFAVLMSLVIEFEFWSLVLSLGLLYAGVLSLNGALGLVAGELIGRNIFFLWKSRDTSLKVQSIVKQFTFASILGVIVGLLIAGELRAYTAVGFSGEAPVSQERCAELIGLFIIILFFQLGSQMTWGHFREQLEKILSK